MPTQLFEMHRITDQVMCINHRWEGYRLSFCEEANQNIGMHSETSETNG